MRLSRTIGFEAPRIGPVPIVAVVFQLGLFFVLALDLSRRQLDALTNRGGNVEAAATNLELKIESDGRILAGGELLYDPLDDDGRARLSEFLVAAAERIDSDPRARRTGKRLLVRADPGLPFEHVQTLLELCSRDANGAWSTQLSTGEVEEGR